MSATGNKVRGAYTYLKGKLMRKTGEATGDRGLQARGASTQAKGGARYGKGKYLKK